MAVSLTHVELSAALRLGDSTEETAEARRLLAFTTEAISKHLGASYAATPEVIVNEAAIRLAGYLFDQPNAGRGISFANAGRNSGAWTILLPYRVHRAGSTGDAIAAAQQAVGTVGNPVTGLAITADGKLEVIFADGSTVLLDLPAGMGGGGITGTGDLLVERIGTLDNPTLPDDRKWLGTGVVIPDGIHVLMIDAGQASDDYHLVDWDSILTHGSVVAGAISMAGDFETFQGDAFTYLRIGHGADNEVLIANDSTGSINLAHVHLERLLAPIGSGGSGIDQIARDSAAAAQTAAEDAANTASSNAGKLMPPSGAEADNATSTTIRGWTASLIRRVVEAIVPDWARDTTTPVPSSKISASIRGHRVFVQTTAPTVGVAGDVWIRDVTGSHPSIYEHNGTSFRLDYSFYGSRVHYQTSPVNVALSTPNANFGDLLFNLVSGTLTIYRRNNAPPWWVSIGTVTGGGGGGTPIDVGTLSPFVEEYALKGTSTEIEASRFPFAIPNWLAAPISHGIPWSLLSRSLQVWTEKINTDVIPDGKLPVERFLPSASGVADGKIPKVSGEAWVLADDLAGETGVVVPAVYERIGGPMSYGTDNTADVVATDWRGYERLIGVFKRTQDSVDYPFEILTHTLDQEGEVEVPLEQNARIDIYRIANSDTLTFANLNGITGSPTASDTIEAWGYRPPVGGSGGGVLTASGVTGLTVAAGDEVHSSVIFPGVFGGVLRKYSFGNLIALMRSTVGVGRQINPTGSTSNLGKVPVLQEDGADFHYQLQKPAELPTIASNIPNSPAQMNPAILYKDTPEGDTANGIYYRRKHDRESVIIAINDTSPRSFGTEHRSFGWTSRIILDTAEPVPGVSPYPSVPTHWEAFIRVQNIASGLYEWRLYTDEMFTTETTIYLDMRDQDDPDTHIQNVAMTKPVNEAYWTTGTYLYNVFPFYGIAGRARRPIIRIRTADDTLSTSIIHLIPVDDVREELVDEDRLHTVQGDLLDTLAARTERRDLGTYVFDLQGENGTYWKPTGILAPKSGKLFIRFTDLEWDHSQQSIDRIYEASPTFEIEVSALLGTTVRDNLFGAIQSNPGGAPDTFFGIRLDFLEFHVSYFANRTILLGALNATADSVWTGTIHIEAGL